MQRSEKVMESTSQMPQVTASAAQPTQIANEPQQIQHGRTTQGHKDTRKQNMIVPQHVQEISTATSSGSEDLPAMPQQAPDVSTMSLQSLRPVHGAQQTRQVMCDLQGNPLKIYTCGLREKPQVMCTLQTKPQMSAQQKQHINTEQQQMQQAKTMQHQRQQAVTASKKTYASHGTQTTSPIMPSLQEMLEESPVAQQCSENTQTQLSTNNTLQKIQVKTQQCEKQQEMVELLQEDGTSPSNLTTVLTTLPTPQKAIHVFIAPEQALQSTPAPQMAKDDRNASQKNPQTMAQSQLNPQMITSSQTSATKYSQEAYMEVLKALNFSSVLELVSLTPMISPNPSSTGSFGDIPSRSDNEQDITVDIQNQSVHYENMHKPNIETIQKVQEQPSPILSDFHKNIMAALLTDEDAEIYFTSDCKSTPPISKDKLNPLQYLMQCDFESTDSDTSSTSEFKESTYVRKMRRTYKVRGIKEPTEIIPETGSYCRLRHSLLQIRSQKSSKQQTESCNNTSSAKMVFCFQAKDGGTVHLGPSAVLMSPQRFMQRISIQKRSEESTSKTDQLKIFCGLHPSSKEPIIHAKISGVKISVTPIHEILHYLSRQGNPNALKAHVYVFSALLQKLHLRNQAAFAYFKDIVAEYLTSSKVLTAHQHVDVADSKAQTGAGRETIRAQDGSEFHITTSEGPVNINSTDESTGLREELLQNLPARLDNKQAQERKESNIELLKGKKRSTPTRAPRTIVEAVTRFCAASPPNSPGFIDRVHLQMLLRLTAAVLNNRASLNIQNNRDTSIQTVSQTKENKKIGRCCVINWNHKLKSSNKARDQLKNLKHCCLTCKTKPSVTSGGERNNSVVPSSDFNSRSVSSFTMPARMPKRNEQEDMKKTMILAKLQEWRELCNIIYAGEDAIMTCAGSDPSSEKTQKPEMTQASKGATDSKPNVRSGVSSSRESGFTPMPGELYLLMPADDQNFMVWNLLIDSVDGKDIEAKFYEAGEGGFIEYMKTSEVLQHANRSNSATKHSKSKSTRTANNTVPSCNCNTCTDADGGPTAAISSAAIVIDSYEVLMQALVPGATLEARHCKREHATEMLQNNKNTEPDDTKKDNTKKDPQGKRRRRH